MTAKHAVGLSTFVCCCLVLCVSSAVKQGATVTVTDGASLGAALKREDVKLINIRGKIRLSKQTWISEGTVNIRNGRHVILQADEPGGAQAVLDMGTLVDAIHVGNASHLELRRLRIPNCASRHVHKPSPHVRLRVAGIFALWPSITLAINSSMSFSDSVFYYWSDKEWDSCDKFRSAATGVLNPKGFPDMLEWTGSDTTVFIKGSQNTSQALIDIVKNKTYVGAFNTTRTNHTLVCLPDPFTDVVGGVPYMTILGILSSIALAAGIAQYMGLIELRPSVVASVHGSSRNHTVPILGSNGQIIGFGSRGSLGSGGAHPSHPSAVEHLSGVLRERQKALLGGLELGELLGRGSFGKVYKGRWRGAMVAVKIVTHDRTLATLAETLRESALSTSIQHPNVVTTFKVRTIRSQGGSNDQASAALTWTTAEEGCLDKAAGGQQQLFARAMSIAGGAKPAKLGRTESGNLEFTPFLGSGGPNMPTPHAGPELRGAHSRSLPQQTHDSAGSSASLTPPRSGYASRSLPSTPPGSKNIRDLGPLGTSTSLLQRSSRDSAAASREGHAHHEGPLEGKMDTSQLAARAFGAAGQANNAEPLSVALQMKAAAAIAAELPAATGEAAETLEARLQDISASSQARQASGLSSAPQGPVSQGEVNDDRVPLELTRAASRKSRASMDMPAVPQAATQAAHEPEQPMHVNTGSGPRPSYLSPEDDEPEPLSMSMKGGLPSYQQPALTAKSEPDQASRDSDEPEPLSMSIKGGSIRTYGAPVPAQDLHADEPEPLSWGSRKPAASPVESSAPEEDADAPELLSMSRKSHVNRSPVSDHGPAGAGAQVKDGHSDASCSDNSAGHGSNSSLRGSAESYAGLLMSAREKTQPAASGFAGPGPLLPGSGQPGQAEEPSTAAELEPEPLEATRKPSSGLKSIRAGTPRPSDRLKPPGLPSAYKRSSSIGIPGTLSAIASKMPSFGRKSPSLLPSTPEDGPGILGSSESKPSVPAELRDGHSTGMHGSAAAQIQEAAEDAGPELLETWLILEYCDQGSFDHAIRSGKFNKDLAAGVLCLMDIAAGMEHLHSLGVLHADLKGANVLLKSSAVSNYDKRGYSCKLADFGLSRVMEHNSTHISTSTFGTAAYMPAELLMEGKMTKAADVYSFAMLMHELLTGQQLFEGMRQSQIICKVITGWRPGIPKGSPQLFVDLMSECWHASLERRPHFPEILLRLRGIYKELRMAAG